MEVTDFEKRAELYHRNLPGLIRAALVDYGISSSTTDRYLIGWDGQLVTIPVRNLHGRVVFFERWDLHRVGRPVDRDQPIELFGASSLPEDCERLFIAEGVHEALILQSHGLDAVAATGTGRFFKCREWKPVLQKIPEIYLAYKRGEHVERSRFLLSRDEVRWKARECLSQAVDLTWPEEVGSGGAFNYFVKRKHSRRDFDALVDQP